ncbi:IPTL-CTERM sorting domain-containing protein [Rhodoferax sp.]|uniref:IPTL-CTERM sorting domain-containing protein n=1 Tax=Rhodoferax sp. TaxID=50421 RepID=UPI002636D372|nr:IPTL-CTERM sorting domain-containing protein [Rhodoferax sp.]MDD2917654.1 IPTL-CTERM sorting domain-containing protein [Rhodoferax sp.]
MKLIRYISVAIAALALMFSGASQAASSYNFTTCGATGPTGPSQGNCDAAYSGTTLAGAVTMSGGIQTWTVPTTGTYRIEVSGAKGGDSIAGDNGTFIGGSGATIGGDFHLTAGEQINILIGQEAPTVPTAPSDSPLSGGGGGSFVWQVTGNTLLIAAGGGGGAGDGYNSIGGNGADGVATGAGSLPAGVDVCASLAAPGGGWTTTYYTCGDFHAGGGAGWNSNGVINADSCSNGTGTDALSPLNGGTGGEGNDDLEPETGPGGFGGGGGSATQCGSTGGGGGGGYTGGAGLGCSATDGCGPGGGGGGSFNSGANPTALNGANAGDGVVTITAVSAAPVAAIPTLSQWALLMLALMIVGAAGLYTRVSRPQA